MAARQTSDKGIGRGGKGSDSTLTLAGIYELSGRPNVSKVADLSQATWDSAASKAIVERPAMKHLAVMGHWVGGGCGSGEHKKIALFPEETLLLVEQGLLMVRMAESTRILSVAEVQALALSQAQICPLYFEVYAHAREIGLVALRLELLQLQQPAIGIESASESIEKGPIKCKFRGRPMLALWSAARACHKGWRRSSPEFILVTSRSCEALPSASEWAHIESMAISAGATVRIAVVDDTGSPVFFECSSGSMSHKESDGGQEPPGDGASCAASLGGGASLEGAASASLVSIKAQVKLQGDKVRALKAEHNMAKDKKPDHALQLECALPFEIAELLRLKALLPPDELADEERNRKKKKKGSCEKKLRLKARLRQTSCGREGKEERNENEFEWNNMREEESAERCLRG